MPVCIVRRDWLSCEMILSHHRDDTDLGAAFACQCPGCGEAGLHHLVHQHLWVRFWRLRIAHVRQCHYYVCEHCHCRREIPVAEMEQVQRLTRLARDYEAGRRSLDDLVQRCQQARFTFLATVEEKSGGGRNA